MIYCLRYSTTLPSERALRRYGEGVHIRKHIAYVALVDAGTLERRDRGFGTGNKK